MGKVTLAAGAEWNTLDADELDERLHRHGKFLRAGEGAPVHLQTSALCNAAGSIPRTAPQLLSTVPVGYVYSIHRISVGDSTSTSGAPLTTAGAYFEIFVAAVDYARLVWAGPEPGDPSGSPVIPSLMTEGFHSGKIARGGENIVIVGSGFPANDVLQVGIQVISRPEDSMKWSA